MLADRFKESWAAGVCASVATGGASGRVGADVECSFLRSAAAGSGVRRGVGADAGAATSGRWDVGGDWSGSGIAGGDDSVYQGFGRVQEALLCREDFGAYADAAVSADDARLYGIPEGRADGANAADFAGGGGGCVGLCARGAATSGCGAGGGVGDGPYCWC